MAERDHTQIAGWVLKDNSKAFKGNRFKELSEQHMETIRQISNFVGQLALDGDKEGVLFFGLAFQRMIDRCTQILESKEETDE